MNWIEIELGNADFPPGFKADHFLITQHTVFWTTNIQKDLASGSYRYPF